VTQYSFIVGNTGALNRNYPNDRSPTQDLCSIFPLSCGTFDIGSFETSAIIEDFKKGRVNPLVKARGAQGEFLSKLKHTHKTFDSQFFKHMGLSPNLGLSVEKFLILKNETIVQKAQGAQWISSVVGYSHRRLLKIIVKRPKTSTRTLYLATGISRGDGGKTYLISPFVHSSSMHQETEYVVNGKTQPLLSTFPPLFMLVTNAYLACFNDQKLSEGDAGVAGVLVYGNLDGTEEELNSSLSVIKATTSSGFFTKTMEVILSNMLIRSQPVISTTTKIEEQIIPEQTLLIIFNDEEMI
jgi:hypothetical protein